MSTLASLDTASAVHDASRVGAHGEWMVINEIFFLDTILKKTTSP
jgi:hypothetical protein